jgi:3-oxoacyl-[acyl-carrier protein] reductase
VSLKDKVVWITGASRGIGRAVALACAAEGAATVLTARHKDHLADTAATITAAGGQEPTLLDYDITNLQAVERAFNDVFRHTRRLDGLVNNAGIMQDALLGMITAEQVETTFAVNVSAAIYHMQYAARLMGRAKTGSIVNISSIMGRCGYPGKTTYSASKAAVIGATLAAAKELAPAGIRVNAVAPGVVDTDLIRNITASQSAAAIDHIGLGRIGSPSDVAACVVYLLSAQSQYVTGQVIGIDGCMAT